MSEDVFFLNSTISEMELDKKRIKAANKLFQKGLESLGNFIDDGYLDMFRDATEEEADQGNYNRRIMFVSLMAEYLINNEEISEYKLSSLFEIAEYFDFDDSIVKQLLHPTQEDLEHYYDVLDCSADANLDEVKKSFRQKSKEFHPDSRSKDMDTAENEEADRKFRELSEAWNKIKAYHYEIDN
jgi:DnaJ-domain-containing protein 1